MEEARAPTPPAMDDGTDSHPATGPPPPAQEALDPRSWGSAEPSRGSPEAPRDPRSRRRRRRQFAVNYMDPITGLIFPTESSFRQFIDRRSRESRTSSEASFSAAPPSDHPGTGTHVRQSALYSDRPRRGRSRTPALAEEYTREESSSELGVAVDLPTIQALSLSEPPLPTPQIAEESNDEYPMQPVPVRYEFGTVGPRTPHYSAPLPRPKWLGGVRGQGRFKKNTGDASSSEVAPTVTVPSRSEALPASDTSFIPQSNEEKPPKDSDADMEEELRLLREYYLKNPPTSLRQAFDEILAVEHATLTTLAAEWGTEPPPPPRKLLPVDQETQSLQAEEHASAAVAQPESITSRQPSDEASMEEIIKNGKRWMCDEVMMCFRKYAERRSKLKILESNLDELCHQCLNVEDYNKVFHHYNFKVKMRKPDSPDCTVRLYFAEVKEIFGRKYYFCCPLEPNENGHCYACMSQGVKDLKHLATGGFEMGSTDATLFGYAEE